MSCFMLDTDMSSYIIRGKYPSVMSRFMQCFAETCISSITFAELRYGAVRRADQQLTNKVNSFCNLVPCIEWNVSAAEVYAEIRSALEKDGVVIGSMDMLIAASAIAENATLVTNNLKHFSRIRELKLENWVDS